MYQTISMKTVEPVLYPTENPARPSSVARGKLRDEPIRKGLRSSANRHQNRQKQPTSARNQLRHKCKYNASFANLFELLLFFYHSQEHDSFKATTHK